MSFETADLRGVKEAAALVNPVSSTSSLGQRRLRELQKAAPFEIEVHNTSKKPEVNDVLIGTLLEHYDLLVVVSGDGGANQVVRKIVANGLSKEAKHTPILAIGGGNANDGVRAKHTKKHLRYPEKIIEDGRIVPTYPIRCDVDLPDGGLEMHSAAFYATLGATGLAASEHYLNNPDYRNSLLGKTRLGRAVSEPLLALSALRKARVGIIEENGDEHSIYNLLIANSRLMAKHLRFPTQLTERMLFKDMIPDKHFSGLAAAAIGYWQGNRPGQIIVPGVPLEFKLKSDMYAQFDGEPVPIPADSQVRFSIHDEPIMVVVTNPDL
jgi:diacylglycerol kinase family enzyme